jgi:hypothetical protein
MWGGDEATDLQLYASTHCVAETVLTARSLGPRTAFQNMAGSFSASVHNLSACCNMY